MPKKHLIFIGMPGCGKSSVGAAVAQSLGLPFVDADVAFTERYHISPADCITAQGECAFREKESVLLADLLAQAEPLVLACGGGVVERQGNVDALREGGLVLFLERPLCDLATEGRPLSARHGVAALWERRQPLYVRAAHLRVMARQSVACTAQAVLACLKGEGFYV